MNPQLKLYGDFYLHADFLGDRCENNDLLERGLNCMIVGISYAGTCNRLIFYGVKVFYNFGSGTCNLEEHLVLLCDLSASIE